MKLQRKLFLLCLAIALVSSLLAAAVGLLLVRGTQTATIARSLDLLAHNVATRQTALVLSPPRSLDELQAQAEVEQTRLLVLDPQGQVLLDSAEQATGNTIALPISAQAVGSATPLPRLTVRQRLNGEDLFVVPLLPPGATQVDQLLALAVPAATLDGGMLDSALRFSLITLMLVGVAAAVGWVASQRLSQPLISMSNAARQMAKGNYDVHLTPTKGDDDLSVVAENFNYMAGEVKAARQTQRNFLANVSHDLRTPLTSIQGFSQALMDGAIPSHEQQQRVAGIIYAEASRLSRLVQDLLDLARIEAGRFTMNQRDMDLNQILDQCGDKFRSQASAYGIEFNVQRPRRALPVRGDAERLEQVVTNLVDSAFTWAGDGGHVQLKGMLGGVRGTGRGGGGGGAAALVAAAAGGNGTATPATVATTENGENGSGNVTEKLGRWWVEVTVSDDGPGIPEGELPYIFERFYQSDPSSSNGQWGLGLAIAREIVVAHGGDLQVQSTPGQGTSFIVRLPMNVGS